MSPATPMVFTPSEVLVLKMEWLLLPENRDIGGFVEEALATAFLANEEQGTLGLELRKTKSPPQTTRQLMVHACFAYHPVWPSPTLEDSIFRLANESVAVDDLVRALLTDRELSPFFSSEVYRDTAPVLMILQGALVQRGLKRIRTRRALRLFRVKGFEIPPAMGSESFRELAKVKQLLYQCRVERPEVWAQLSRGIHVGVLVATSD